jgi:1,4-dihydroxy-2-naphthoyl-CoA synthase
MSSGDNGASSNGRGSDSWLRSWTHFGIDRRTPGYCRVTFRHPPTNTVTETTVAELAELVDLIEEDEDLAVVVFDSATPGFYLGGPTGVRPWLELLVRLSSAPVLSIASIRGRVRGAGIEFVRACDLRFASRENAALDRLQARVNRLVADSRLDAVVDAVARRLAPLDHEAIARAKLLT